MEDQPRIVFQVHGDGVAIGDEHYDGLEALRDATNAITEHEHDVVTIVVSEWVPAEVDAAEVVAMLRTVGIDAAVESGPAPTDLTVGFGERIYGFMVTDDGGTMPASVWTAAGPIEHGPVFDALMDYLPTADTARGVALEIIDALINTESVAAHEQAG